MNSMKRIFLYGKAGWSKNSKMCKQSYKKGRTYVLPLLPVYLILLPSRFQLCAV